MKALMISRDEALLAEMATQGAARIPPMRLVARSATLREASERAAPEAPQLVILDASGIDSDDADLIERLGRSYPDACIIMLTREHQQDL